MKLKDLFAELAFGELSNLSMADAGDGTINPNSHAKLINATNNALKTMFSRVHLLDKELIIQSIDWKSLYYLRKEHAVMDPSPEIKYILDTPDDPFTGDLVKVLQVTNEVGDPLPMNDSQQWASVFTPHFDAIQLTHVGYDQVFGVTYQALHPKLFVTGEGVLDQEIRIPSLMEEILKLQIASVIFSAMSGQDFSIKAQQLEAACEIRYTDLTQKNLIGDSGVSTNVKIHLRGFP